MSAFAPGSVSLRLYPHNDLPASDIVAELRAQARLAVEHGFDGVMVSEHHGGFAGYLCNPIQMAGWLLEAMPSGWAAPCPVLLPLRPAAGVAEELAWMAARFPDRVGLGVASGSLESDFELMHVPMDGLTARFTAGLEEVAEALRGPTEGVLAGDPAIRRCAEHPVPLLSAAMGFTAVRRAARVGAGLIFESLSTPERVRALTDAYHEAGGSAPAVMVRRAWVGPPPRELLEQQLEVYRSYSLESAMDHWGGDELIGAATGDGVAAGLAGALERADVDALNIRIHVPGVTPEAARAQIARLGDEVLPPLRKLLAALV